ncbi:hypothetical protein MIND_01104300 [Mycena indigotica]|uniref:DUF300-domain-containing protein n=1 Tax=Mycena indigotica TaxID=2126181 RepID=A0A8H6S9U7_9AGAR|nr:uncharacterized protein MIND_01104300 [Mycena indigotica]KAF7295641.1 hypothetical protein MIND_01104300 [Mycena indigotica]
MVVTLAEGAGNRLPTVVLTVAGICTLVAVIASGMSIHFHLRNYRKPALQRMVIRIMIMVPLYAISSLISLFSLDAAFFIDAIRDIYEAFVIYCFFVLLLSYLGGERSLLIMLHGRPPKDPVFPVSLFKREIDVSDPYMFLFLKRGILQYVQVKPILAIATLILKALGKYNEGTLRSDSGYLYISIVYNISICLSLYCLAVFWMCVNDDLKPFRPVPKFLCVKGILFFSFWQALFISILVSAGAISHLGPYTRDEDKDTIALALTDLLICIEMPMFAIAHAYAFSYTDFVDSTTIYAARMPMYYALRDAFGLKDVVADSRATLRGEGMDYREFEPSEGYMHQGEGRDRRIRAGLRYADGGRRKYWLPQPAERTHVGGETGGRVRNALGNALGHDDGLEDVHAPLLASQEEDVVHLAPDLVRHEENNSIWVGTVTNEEGYRLPFGDPDALGDEELFSQSRKFMFGDYNYPVLDVSSETARTRIWDEEERVLRDERSAWFSPVGGRPTLEARERQKPRWEGYGAVGETTTNAPSRTRSFGPTDQRLVDHNDNFGPSHEADVKLRWTRSAASSRTNSNTSTSNAAAARARLAQANRISHRGSFGPNESAASSPRSPPSLGNSRQSSVLPPDAVDLVVEEDSGSTSPGLKRVYRRGFVDPEDGIEGEVEVQSPRSVEQGEEVAEAVIEELPGEGREDIVVRVRTPPVYAQVHEENNPWAS